MTSKRGTENNNSTINNIFDYDYDDPDLNFANDDDDIKYHDVNNTSTSIVGGEKNQQQQYQYQDQDQYQNNDNNNCSNYNNTGITSTREGTTNSVAGSTMRLHIVNEGDDEDVTSDVTFAAVATETNTTSTDETIDYQDQDSIHASSSNNSSTTGSAHDKRIHDDGTENMDGSNTVSNIESNNHDNDDDNNDNENDIIIVRLKNLNNKVQKLTKEAYRNVTITTTIPKWNTNTSNDSTNISNENVSTTTNEYNKKLKSEASFQLGLALFGQSITSIESDVQDQMQDMENEISYITNAVDGLKIITTTTNTSTSTSTTDNKSQLLCDTQKLHEKIKFLKYCSTARLLIDQARTVSTPGLSSVSSLSSNSNSNSNELDYIAASKYTIQAIHSLNMARIIIDTSTINQSMTSRQAAYTMIESIQIPIRRKKVELIDIAHTLISQCIIISSTNNSIVVRSPETALTIAYNIFEIFSINIKPLPPKKQIPVTEFTNNDYTDDDDEDEYEYEYEYDYDYDKILDGKFDDMNIDGISNRSNSTSNDIMITDESMNTELGLVLRKLTRQIQNDVFDPVLDAMMSKGSDSWKYNSNKTMKQQQKQEQELKWIFEEVDENSNKSKSYIPSTTTAAASTKLSSINSLMKGPVYSLKWKLVTDTKHCIRPTSTSTTTTSKNSESNSNQNINDNDSDNDTTIVRSVFEWNNVFEYINTIMTFISKRILVQRKSLCAFFSMRFFGKPFGVLPLMMNDNTSNANAKSNTTTKTKAKRSPPQVNLQQLGELESIRFGDDNSLLLHPLIETFEETCVPSYLPNTIIVTEIKNRGDYLQHYIHTFITKLTECSIHNEYGTRRLLQIANSFADVYIHNRRCTLLASARDMLVQNDYHNTIETGEDVRPSKEELYFGLQDGMEVCKLHKAAISDTAYKLIHLVRQTMDEATEYSETIIDETDTTIGNLVRLPATLYQTSRDMLDMFRSIIPVSYGYEIETVPRTAAVLHNDCVFLAHHCLMLGVQYKDRFVPASYLKSLSSAIETDEMVDIFSEEEPTFPTKEKEEKDIKDSLNAEASTINFRAKLLQQTCVFFDMVPSFRELANRSLGDMINVQTQQLVVLISDNIQYLGQSLGSNDISTPIEWTQTETAIQSGLYHLRHVGKTWKIILSYSIYNRCLCYLVDVIFSLLIDQVLIATSVANRDISRNGCRFIYTLFVTTIINDIEYDILIDNDHTSSRLWDRFIAFGKFMDMSILDIQNSISDGFFTSVTANEISNLIVSCFDDTPKRQSLLQLLK